MHLLLLTLILAAPLPPKVEQAERWDAPETDHFEVDFSPPTFRYARVGRRDPQAIKEWRDRRQNYAVFWTARPRGYRALQIRLGRYEPLLDDRAPDGRHAQLHARFEDAHRAVNAGWHVIRPKR